MRYKSHGIFDLIRIATDKGRPRERTVLSISSYRDEVVKRLAYRYTRIENGAGARELLTLFPTN